MQRRARRFGSTKARCQRQEHCFEWPGSWPCSRRSARLRLCPEPERVPRLRDDEPWPREHQERSRLCIVEPAEAGRTTGQSAWRARSVVERRACAPLTGVPPHRHPASGRFRRTLDPLKPLTGVTPPPARISGPNPGNEPEGDLKEPRALSCVGFASRSRPDSRTGSVLRSETSRRSPPNGPVHARNDGGRGVPTQHARLLPGSQHPRADREAMPRRAL